MSIEEELMTYLESQGVGTLGVSLFVGEIPDGDTVDDNAIVLNAGGGPREKFTGPRNIVSSIVVRNKTYTGSKEKYEEISGLLHKNPNCITEFVVGGKEIHDIYIEDEAGFVGKDNGQRYLFEFQLQIYYV